MADEPCAESRLDPFVVDVRAEVECDLSPCQLLNLVCDLEGC